MPQEATAANIAAFRKRRDEKAEAEKALQEKLISQATGASKKRRIREQKTAAADRKVAEEAAARRETTQQKAASKKAAAQTGIKPTADLVAAGQIPTAATGITVTTEQAERIKAGTLKATPETTAAVLAGNVNIVDPTPGQIVGGLVLGAIGTRFAAGGISVGKLGGVKLATKSFLKTQGGKGRAIGQLPRDLGTGIADNTATNKLLTAAANKLVIGKGWKILGAATVALIVAKEILQLTFGGKVFGQFLGMEEASQTVNIAARDSYINARTSEGMDLYDQAAAARNEVLQNPTFWENIASYIPFKNVLDKLDNYRDAAIVAAEVYDKLAEHKRLQIETGETDEEIYRRGREEKKANDIAVIDHYNSERKIMLELEREARTEERKSKRKEEKKARNEDAKFWAREREKQREREAEDRQAVADFWSAYNKEKAKLAVDSRPSNLNFGLL